MTDGRRPLRRRDHVLGAGLRAGADLAVGRRATRSRTPASARPPTSIVVAPGHGPAARRLRRRHLRRPADRHPARHPGARWSCARRCTPRCGSTRRCRTTWRRCAGAACTSSSPRSGAWPAATSAPAAWPTRPTIVAAVERVLGAAATSPGCAVVVTAGGTREPIDAVRVIANRSSGKQGHAHRRRGGRAAAPRSRSSPPSTGPVPAGVERRRGRDRRRDGAGRARRGPTAPTWSSWPPPSPTSARRRRPTDKIKKADGVARDRPRADPRHPRRARRGASAPGQILVGFAAETDDLRRQRRAASSRASAST